MKEIQLINHSNGIVEVNLNRPEKKNGLSFDMIFELEKLGKKLSKQKDIRVIILTGNKDFFSSGIDISNLNQNKNRLLVFLHLIKPGKNIFQKVNLIWRNIPVPVITSINGFCYGAGFQLALGADFRIASENATFSFMEAKWGLIPDMGVTVTLRGLMPLDKAKELAMTARVFNAQEAKELNLVTYIHQNPLEKALELANEIINRSPDSVGCTKKILNAMVSQSESRSLFLEKRLQLRILLGKNTKIAFKKDKDNSLKFVSREIN